MVKKYVRHNDKDDFGTIAVDFDGVLAYYESWDLQADKFGKPIKPMIIRVRKWLGQGKKVVVFTARARYGEKMVRKVQDWLEEAGLPRLEVTNIKMPSFQEMWDDRAIAVEKNTGRILGGKASKIG